MTITEDTGLDELVPSDTIKDAIEDTIAAIINKISARINVLGNELSNGGLASEKVMADVHNNGQKVRNEYNDLITDLNKLANNITYFAVTKEIEELDILIEKLEAAIAKNEEEKKDLEQKYNDGMNELKSALAQTQIVNNIKAKAIRMVTLPIPIIGTYLEYSRVPYYINSYLDATKAIADFDVHYNGPFSGEIPKREHKIKLYKVKKQGAEKRKAYLQSMNVKYEGNIDTSSIVGKAGDALGKGAATILGQSMVEVSKGQRVEINGKNYVVAGFVTDPNGKSVAIYKDYSSEYCYYIDPNGNTQNVYINDIAKRTFIIDGNQYKIKDVEEKGYIPSNILKQGLGSNSGNQNSQKVLGGGPGPISNPFNQNTQNNKNQSTTSSPHGGAGRKLDSLTKNKQNQNTPNGASSSIGNGASSAIDAGTNAIIQNSQNQNIKNGVSDGVLAGATTINQNNQNQEIENEVSSGVGTGSGSAINSIIQDNQNQEIENDVSSAIGAGLAANPKNNENTPEASTNGPGEGKSSGIRTNIL